MLVKHSKRTVRRACTKCGSTDLYWAHDTASTHGTTVPSCSACGVTSTAAWVLINKDGTRHSCVGAMAAPEPTSPPVYEVGDRYCKHYSPEGRVCTREHGHSGPHAASDLGPGCETWPNTDDRSEPAPEPARKKLPEPKPVGSYFPRYIDGSTTDVELLQTLRTGGHHVLLEGPPGTGKTALAMAAHGSDLQTVVCSADTEDSDFQGTWTQNPDGTFAWHDGPIIVAAENGWPIFVDEVNLAPPSVLSRSLYPLMDGRGEIRVYANPERGIIKAQPGFVVIGAANPNVPGGRFSEALLSRFTLHVTLLTDWTIASRLDIGNDFVRVAKNLDVKARNGEVEWVPQIRDGIAWRDLSKLVNLDFAWRALISSAPEDSRPIVAKVVSAVAGHEIEALTLSAGM